MPVKKKPIKKPTTSSKASAKADVKQVVNVRVGDIKTKRKVVRRPATKLPEPQSALFRQAPINVSLSTQSYQPAAAQPYVNEYNSLLKQLTEERRVALQSVPILAPNNAPLTINQQRNTLLNRLEREPTPFTPIVEATAISLAEVVKGETYDDPLSNENMFVNSSRLGEKLTQKLPVSNFDYNDINDYDSENMREQNALAEQAKQPQKKKKLVIQESESEEYATAASKPSGRDALTRKKNEAYSDYVNYIKNVNERYNLEENVKPQTELKTLSEIKKEIKKIDNRIVSKSQLTIPMYKK